jgi:hypothetical protein
MPKVQNDEETKCVAVQLPVSLIRKLEEYKAGAGKSKNAVLVELIRKGLDST